MAHVDSALAGVEERDKWRRRLEVLETSLAELLDRRRRLEQRLKQVRDELQKLERTAREFVDLGTGSGPREVANVVHGPFLR
jgi:phage shock protein A